MATPDLTSLLAYDSSGNHNSANGAVTSATYGNETYKYKRTETISGLSYYIYDRHNGSAFVNSNDINAVKVLASDITTLSNWSDYGTDFPVTISAQSGNSANMEFTSGTYLFFRCALPSSGSGGGSGDRQTFSSGESGIINVEFNKLTDSSIELGFDWQGISVYQVYVDRGGTESWSQHSLTGADGTVSGYVGTGANALTGLNEGDKVWVNNATDANGKLPVYTHTKIDWSVGVVSGIKSVIGKTFGYDTGQSFDIMFYSYMTRNASVATTSSTIQITHDGTLQTVSLPWERGRTYNMLNFVEDAYGSPYIVKKLGSSSNFW